MAPYQTKQVIMIQGILQSNKIKLLFVLLTFISNPAYSICLDWSSLRGYQIIDSNQLRKLDCPIGGKYDCLTWPDNFYEWGSRCVKISGYFNYSDEAILMSNGTTNQMVTIGMFNKPECHAVTIYTCPSLY